MYIIITTDEERNEITKRDGHNQFYAPIHFTTMSRPQVHCNVLRRKAKVD